MKVKCVIKRKKGCQNELTVEETVSIFIDKDGTIKVTCFMGFKGWKE